MAASTVPSRVRRMPRSSPLGTESLLRRMAGAWTCGWLAPRGASAIGANCRPARRPTHQLRPECSRGKWVKQPGLIWPCVWAGQPRPSRSWACADSSQALCSPDAARSAPAMRCRPAVAWRCNCERRSGTWTTLPCPRRSGLAPTSRPASYRGSPLRAWRRNRQALRTWRAVILRHPRRTTRAASSSAVGR